ncbi:MAG: zinc-dependent dehydrogenase [Armatimonadetes bacterium]|nr:zinc-dependent dehydrogenase [Armatimonadota bacterium]
MKVGMYYNNHDVRVEEMPRPEPGPGEVLMRVRASGICGSDIMEWYRIKRAPLVLGHEVTGDVAQVGEGVEKFAIGDRVWATHHVPCNTCHYCLTGHHTACETLHTTSFHPGGFAEYVLVPALQVDRGMMLLPDEVSYEDGSFIEPLGTVVRGQRRAGVGPGDSVLVLGCGIAGLLHIKLAAALGAGRIMATDINGFRMDAARRFGADAVCDAREDVPGFVREVNGRPADRVIICAGALSAAEQALQCVDRGGVVLFFAVPRPGETLAVDFNPFWRNDVTFASSYGSAPVDSAEALELIRSRRVVVSDMITHRLPLDEIQEGFRLAAEGAECLKVIIEPG